MLNFSKLGFTPMLYLDDGHGMETAGKRTPIFPDGHFIHEDEFNRAVIAFMKADAERLGFKVQLVAPEDTDTPLQTRTDRANAAWSAYVKQLEAQGIKLADPKKAGIYYSQHYNAMNDTWDASTAAGVGTYFYTGSVEGKKLATAIQKYVSQGTQQTNRGVIEANFHVLRETRMYAALNEAGFMDDPVEAARMLLAAYQKETAAQALAGICEYYGLVYEPEQTPQPKPAAGTAILGAATATAAQAKEWARLHGATAQFIKNIDSYYSLAPICGGVNPVGAIAQSAKETNKGKYGGIVKVEQCNPAGLKITNPKGETAADHMTFNNWDMGIAAHLDHLALYAGAAGYPKTGSPDPRHFPAIKGTAATWEGLGGKYAPSLTYGQDIVAIMKEIAATVIPKEPTPQEIAVDAALAAGIITDRAGWLDVLNGKTPVCLDNLRQAFSNAKGLRRG